MSDTEELQAQILNEYSKSIDTSTILSILSDYDLSNSIQLAEARQTFDILREDADNEEASGFDPSGASGLSVLTPGFEDGREDTESMSARSAQGWKSQTDDTSLSHEMSHLDLQGLDFSAKYIPASGDQSPDNAYPSELDKLDGPGKEKVLIEIFPTLKPFDIKWILKKCKGDASLAIDELMTESFLEESGTRHKGVEAFSESEVPSQLRKGKGKGKRKRTRALQGRNNKYESPTESKWDTARQDVEFITSKTRTPMNQVASLYHENGASIPRTISAIIRAQPPMERDHDENDEDFMLQINASMFHQEFPTISISDLEILIQLTEPSLSNARDLATALVNQPIATKPNIQIELRHAPIKLVSEFTPLTPRSQSSTSLTKPLDAASAAERVSTLTYARDNAYTNGRAAARKGKSDHLMGGAAAYYFEQGRDYGSRVKNAESALADALVAKQSTKTELDLHGVNVKDGVRIAREGVTTWWHELGETRIGAKNTGGGYRIVVGAGRHSEGGKPKLGPAVGKMLIKEGWQVEVGHVALLVTGVAKRR